MAQTLRRGQRREFGILSRTVGCQRDDLEDCDGFRDRLLPTVKDCTPGIRVSKAAFFQGSELHKGDAIIPASGELLLICGFSDVSADVGWAESGILLVADIFVFNRKVTPHSSAFVLSSSSSLVKVLGFTIVPLCYFDGPDCIAVLS